MGNKNMNKAKKAKNDEFYTRLTDIEKELKYYKPQFRGKTVYCNCDDPSDEYENMDKGSQFWNYFFMQFEHFGLKKLISTHYNEGGRSYKLEYEGGGPDNVVETPLQGDGDFRSEESIELLKESDIICTNPPFSLFREYVAQLIEYEKQFLIIGNFNSIGYKEIFPLIKDEYIWLGYTSPKEFIQPDGSIKKFGNITWFTNLEVKRRKESMKLYHNYKCNEDKYPKYDNYDAINVDSVNSIPKDYEGVMGVPITFLAKHSPVQFEILGYTGEGDGGSIRCLKFYENLHQGKVGESFVRNMKSARFSPMIAYVERPARTCYIADNADGYMLKKYHRIFIKNKNPEVETNKEV